MDLARLVLEQVQPQRPGREDPRRVLRVVREQIGGDHELVRERFARGLAALGCHDVDHLFGALDEDVSKAEQAPGALVDVEDAPGRLGPACARDDAFDVGP